MATSIPLTLPPFERGFHLITNTIFKHVNKSLATLPSHGLMSVFIQHSSASLSINENADPSVRADLEAFVNQLIPENLPYYTHTYEGSDDMPAHIKASVFGSSVHVPIINGSLALGTWQGIYLGEHRNDGGARKLIITIIE
ncbi:secondary thiamine-phosphate synthase enzyme YjbQ [Glaciecola petra]|uniref:Secondary thiamine-phosphate synthase enzyme YjbQ n=1 Tax=Glaciecola petra TaxID=3075602 RepID=A0ABU2ZLR2_9ALTE|nr:secondary thiamine-phosphate synthase enzyme YjbQ [Aestuariibacter sp. P117]MDT0593562.1 secondary thiamine-phosphate synthase enzyme YjbQ [Aestuariibacter sp. P117]